MFMTKSIILQLVILEKPIHDNQFCHKQEYMRFYLTTISLQLMITIKNKFKKTKKQKTKLVFASNNCDFYHQTKISIGF